MNLSRRELLARSAAAGAASLVVGAPHRARAAQGTTLRMIASPQPITDAVQALLPQFTQDTGIEVTLDVMGEDQMYTRMLTDGAAGRSSYDLVPQREVDIMAYIQAGITQPLDGLMSPEFKTSLADFPQAYYNAQCIRDDQTWGILFGGGTVMFAYRKDIFDREGLAPPATLDDLMGIAEQLTGGGQYGISFRGQRGHHAAAAWYMVSLIPSGAFFHDLETYQVTLDTPEATAALEFHAALAKFAPPDVSSFTYEDAIRVFNRGDAAMVVDATQLAPFVLDPANSDLAEQVAIGQYPASPDADLPYPVFGWTLGVSAYTEHPQEAMTFIEYFTGPEQARAVVDAGAGPERISIMTDPDFLESQPYYATWLAQFERAKLGQPFYKNAVQFNTIVGTLVNQVLTGGLAPADALRQAQEQTVDMLEEQKDIGYGG